MKGDSSKRCSFMYSLRCTDFTRSSWVTSRSTAGASLLGATGFFGGAAVVSGAAVAGGVRASSLVPSSFLGSSFFWSPDRSRPSNELS